MALAALCFGAGLLVCYAGWRLHKSQELPEGTTGFFRIWSPRVWLGLLSYLLIFIGLMLCFIYTPMFWIARPR
ncbi:MAG: hypothetical protein SF051_16155 [Elusimicrobiota bacterium]|nr:hypothetical protein [Elusimicrobiota bacterium]